MAVVVVSDQLVDDRYRQVDRDVRLAVVSESSFAGWIYLSRLVSSRLTIYVYLLVLLLANNTNNKKLRRLIII